MRLIKRLHWWLVEEPRQERRLRERFENFYAQGYRGDDLARLTAGIRLERDCGHERAARFCPDCGVELP